MSVFLVLVYAWKPCKDPFVYVCRMAHLNTISAVKLEMDSYSAAHALLSQLPSIVSVAKLIIRYQLTNAYH